MSDLVERSPGWSLPQAAYTDADVFAADLDRVFAAHWLFAGHTGELDAAGRYLTVDVGRDRVIVVRGEDGVLHAHHDVCAHRGSRVTSEPRGRVKAFVCPYHQWVYALDGSLRAARLMGDCFATASHRLAPVAVREVAGLVFVCLADEPPDFDAFAGALEPRLGPHGLAGARVAVRQHYRVAANWKTLVENNRECYHCAGSHPEFSLSNFDVGMNGDVRTNPATTARSPPPVPAGARRACPARTSTSPTAPGTASPACRCATASSRRPSTAARSPHPWAASPTPTSAACAWCRCPTSGPTPTATTR